MAAIQGRSLRSGLFQRICICLAAALLVGAPAAAAEQTIDSIRIMRPPPDARGGQAYRLIYYIPLPIKVYWRFKTSFDSPLLKDNIYILDHRLICRDGDVLVTEDRYRSMPDAVFRWRTRIFPERYRMEFELVDGGGHGQRFHYGFIQLEAQGPVTRVTQEAYFDFLGASLWANFPWGGGMHAFLEYTARWERETVLRMQRLFAEPGDSH